MNNEAEPIISPLAADETEEIVCTECGAIFVWARTEVLGRVFGRPSVCPACRATAATADSARLSAQLKAARAADWKTICPAEFRNTDAARVPWQKGWCAATRWQTHVEGKRNPRGLALIHPQTGAGKTRSAYEAVRRAHLAGLGCYSISASRFAWAATSQFGDGDRALKARNILESARSASVLLLDDIGKERMTERPEAELFSVLDDRTNRQKPTIWTANHSPKELLATFSAERGPYIVRRLEEFAEVVTGGQFTNAKP